MLQEVCQTIVYSKSFLLTIKAANVEVRESQDTPSRSLYHVPFVMLEQLPKKGGADFNYNRFSRYIDNKAVVCE